jgi:hypothetical protein
MICPESKPTGISTRGVRATCTLRATADAGVKRLGDVAELGASASNVHGASEFRKTAPVWKPGTNFASTRRRSPVFPELTACPTERGVADRMPDFPILGRQDKSTAAGRGACTWLDWIFLSAPAHALLPLDVKILRKSTVTAPSYLPKPADGPP